MYHLLVKYLEKTELESKDWLVHSREPWPSVLIEWNNSINLRKSEFGDSSKTLTNFFNDWRVLKTKLGYDLVDQDYIKLYPDSHKRLFHNWSSFVPKIIPIIQKEVKEKESLVYLEQLLIPTKLCDGLL